MSIAVTAASGQLGGAVVHALQELETSEQLIGLARTPANAAGLGVEVRPGDYGDPAQLVSALEGVDTLLLVSGNEPPQRRTRQHRNVLDAARTCGVRKVVYTSVQGAEDGTAFSPIVQSNRQTEADLRDSGMVWAVGRNGIYIEPDIEYMDAYREAGEVANSAGDGRCGYTTRAELAHAYACMLTDAAHDEHTYALHGQPITQRQLVDHLNDAFGTDLVYRPMRVDAYRSDRVDALGEFMGTVIAGIYEGIRRGAHDVPSDHATVTGRPHQPWDEYFASLGHAEG